GSFGRPQESPNKPQVSPRKRERPPLPFHISRVGRRGRADGEGHGAAPPACAGARYQWSQRPEGCSMADRGTKMHGKECSRLLTPKQRDGSPDPQGQAPDATGSWHSHSAARFRAGPAPIDHVGAASVADSGGFSPRAAIATGSQPCSTSEAEPAVRIRLRALPLVYLLILALATSWRCALLGDDDVVLHYVDATVIAALGGVLALLSSRWPVSLAWLRALELGM